MADILILTSDFPHLKGGIAAYSFNLMSLLEAKHKVDVCVFGVKSANRNGISYFNSKKIFYPKEIKSIIKKRRYDYILVMTILPLGWMLNLIKHSCKTAYFVYGQEIIAKRGFKPRPAAEAIISKADKIIAISNYTSGLIKQNSSVFYPLAKSVDECPRKKNLMNSEYPFIIGSAGRLVKHKNFISVIRMIKKINSIINKNTGRNVEYHIMGKGPEEREWKRFAEKEGVSDRVRFLGELNVAEADKFYRSIDVLVVPSIKTADAVEGFGMVVQEAALRGVCSAGYGSGGISESIQDIDMIAEEGDEIRLSEIIIKILSDQKFRLNKEETATKNAQKFLISDKRLKEFEAILGF